MLDTLDQAAFDTLQLKIRRRFSAAAVYVSLAMFTILLAIGSTIQINHRLQHSHLIHAHFSRMIENPNKLAIPAHFPVFVAATSTGRIEFLGFTVCNCTTYRLGERTALWLDPKDPQIVTPNRLLDVWFFPFLMVVAAMGFSIFALLAQKPEQPKPA